MVANLSLTLFWVNVIQIHNKFISMRMMILLQNQPPETPTQTRPIRHSQCMSVFNTKGASSSQDPPRKIQVH